MPDPKNKNHAGLHFNKAETQALLKAVMKRSAIRPPTQINKREHQRFVPSNSDATALYEHPGGSADTCHALIFDISAAGVGLIIRGFLHNGTLISVNIKTNDGQQQSLAGVVRWCYYFDKHVHLVGVELHEHIDPRNYAADEEWIKYSVKNDTSSWITDRDALVIEPNPLEFNVIKMFLSNAKIKATMADSPSAGLHLIKENNYDLILLKDSANEDDPVPAIIQNIRKTGYRGPTAVYTSSTDTESALLQKTGATAIIRHPLDLGPFLLMLQEIFENFSNPLNTKDPIYSLLPPENCPEEFLIEYIDMIKLSAKQLEFCIQTDEYNTAINLCNSIHSTGIGYGFPALAETAMSLAKSLNASSSTKESAADVRQLVNLINRLQAKPIERKPTK